MVSVFLGQVCANAPSTIEGGGEQTRHFVHVDDVVQANLAAATTDSVGEAYDVEWGTATSITDRTELLRELTGGGSPIQLRTRSAR